MPKWISWTPTDVPPSSMPSRSVTPIALNFYSTVEPIQITRTKRAERTLCHIIKNKNNSTTRQQIQLFFFIILRPAYCGATKGQTETLRLLVQHQADLWLRSTKGDVPLHEAVACGRKDLVLWILRQCQQQYGENGTGSVGSNRKVQLALVGLTWSTTTAAVHCTSPPLITTWKCARYVPFCWELI